MTWIILGGALISSFALVYLHQRYFAPLEEFPLEPGIWFKNFAMWRCQQDGLPADHWPGVRAAIVEGTHGYIFATDTPEIDRQWFEKRGFEFPKRWVVFSDLEDYEGIPGEVVHLDI